MRKLVLLMLGLALLASTLPLAAAVCVPPDRGQWSTRNPVPAPPGFIVRAWGAFFPDNGKFYSLGGRFADGTGFDVLNPLEYDPQTDTWVTKSASFSDAQVNNMVGGVLDIGGTRVIILVGGSAGGATTATLDVRYYDPIADTITTISSDYWPGNVGGHILPGGAAVYNNKLYVFGGFYINSNMITEIWEYDPMAAQGTRWTQKTAVLPTALGYIPTATSGNYIYLLGGSEYVGGTLSDSVSALRYDPASDTIAPVTANSRAVGETRAVTQTDGTVWVLGGARATPSNEVDVYDPVQDLWSMGPAMPTARRNFPADVDPANGRIWAVGGYDTSGVTPLNVNEEYVCWIFVDGFESGDTTAWSSTVP